MGRLRSCQQHEAEAEPNQDAGQAALSAKGFTGTGDHIDDYGDESTNYWPSGWNFERYRNCEQADLLALPQDELAKLMSGFRAVLGEEGNHKMARVLGESEERRKDTEAEASGSAGFAVSIPAALPPDWLQSYNKRFARQKWGFVVFKTGIHDEGGWEKYKQKFDEIIRLPFREHAELSEAKKAEELFDIRWVEDASVKETGIEQVQEEFAKLVSNLPLGYPQQLFFIATPQSVSHVLKGPIPDTNSERWRPGPPYILAGPSKGASSFEEVPAKTFKVALETVVEELWMLLTDLSWPAAKVSRGINQTPFMNGSEVDNKDATESSDEDELPNVWWTSAPSPSSLHKRRRIQ